MLNGIVSHNDWFVTLLSAAGDPDIQDELKAGRDLNGTTYKVHLDGHDQLDYITGRRRRRARGSTSSTCPTTATSPRCATTTGRSCSWSSGRSARCRVWAEPYTELRVPKIFNLRTDPYERADITSNTYYDWLLDRAWVLVPAQTYVARMLGTLAEFPPRQEPASFNIDKVIAKLQAGVSERVIELPAGTFRMGSDDHYPEEAPTHLVRVDAFAISATTVTNEQFAAFVDSTGYVTVAERPLDPADYPGAPPENLVAGSLVFTMTPGPVDLRHLSQWWTWTPGASWRHPEGPRIVDRRSPRSPGRARGVRGRRGRMRRGRGRSSRPRPNGSTPHAAVPMAARSSGATRPFPAVGSSRTSGRATSRGATAKPTASPARHRSDRSRRTGSACTTWPATSGSGPPTGTRTSIRRTTTSRVASRRILAAPRSRRATTRTSPSSGSRAR